MIREDLTEVALFLSKSVGREAMRIHEERSFQERERQVQMSRGRSERGTLKTQETREDGAA